MKILFLKGGTASYGAKQSSVVYEQFLSMANNLINKQHSVCMDCTWFWVSSVPRSEEGQFPSFSWFACPSKNKKCIFHNLYSTSNISLCAYIIV